MALREKPSTGYCDGCGKPLKTPWELHTEFCTACHQRVGRRHIITLVIIQMGIVGIVALLVLLAGAIVFRHPPMPNTSSLVGAALLSGMLLLFIREARWRLNRCRWHTAPAKPNLEARWTGSNWSQT